MYVQGSGNIQGTIGGIASRRVIKAKKGIYIVGGKKQVVGAN